MTEAVPKTVTSGRAKRVAIILVALAVAAGLYWLWTTRNLVTTDNAKITADVIEISPKVSGKILGLNVKEQEQVKAGQILFRLEDDQYQAELQKSLANLEAAQANLEKARSGARIEERQQAAAAAAQSRAGLERAGAQKVQSAAGLAEAERITLEKETLYAHEAISREEIEAARTRLETARAALAVAQASLTEAEHKLQESLAKQELIENGPQAVDIRVLEALVKQAEAAAQVAQVNLDNTTVRAPVDATVVRINAQPGETFSAGQSVLTLVDLEQVWVTAQLEETKVERLAVGQPVQVKVDAYPGVELNGEIAEIGSAAGSVFAIIPTDTTSGSFTKVVQRFPVKIGVDPAGHSLRPGMSAVITINVK